MADNGARPWFKFYPRDWRADEALRDCSMAARGLWIELMCLMHEATPYGHLLPAGRKPTDQKLAVQVGVSVGELKRLLNELEEARAFSRTPDGVIYSRRMVRDEHLRTEGLRAFREGTNPDSRRGKKRGKSDTTGAPPPQPPRGVASKKNGAPPSHSESRVQKPEDTSDAVASDVTARSDNFALAPSEVEPQKKRKTAMRPDWALPPAYRLYARQQGLDEQTIARQAQNFHDYHLAEETRSADWFASWRLWIGKHLEWRSSAARRQHNGRQVPGSATAAARALLSQIQGDEAETPADLDGPQLRVLRGGLLDG